MLFWHRQISRGCTETIREEHCNEGIYHFSARGNRITNYMRLHYFQHVWFEDLGIMVYVGASGSVEDAIDMWESNNLPAATDENACQQHAFRKHDHNHD